MDQPPAIELRGLVRRFGERAVLRDVSASVPAGATPERVEEVLAAVGMERRAEEPVRQLSRGMVQRLAVCRAVLHEPKLLLLDEPRANLDPAASELVEPLIGRAAGVTRVLTSHDPQAALAEADIVLALRNGRTAYVGDPGQLDSVKLAELYA